MLFDGEIFEHGGRKFKFEEDYDQDMRAPWEEYDGIGIVSEWTNRDKYPGERVLSTERYGYSKRYYDFQATMKKAKQEGWGLSPEDKEKLAKRLGRTPTKGDIVAEAVEKDFEYCRSWANNEWHWVFVGVAQVDEDGNKIGDTEYLGGLNSDDHEHIEMTAHELADNISYRLDKEAKEAEFWAARDTLTR